MTATEIRHASIGTVSTKCRRTLTERINGRMVVGGVIVVLLVFLFVWTYRRQKAIHAVDASGIRMARMIPGARWLDDARRGPWIDEIEHSGWLPGTHVVSRVGPPSRAVTSEALEALVYLQHAEFLWLDRCGLTDDQLAMIAQIEVIKTLDIEGNPITDQGLQHLTTHPSLEFLNIIDTNVTPAGVERFRQLMPRCEVVAVRERKSVDPQPGRNEMRIICH